jgi:hypothetical protein
MIKDHELWSELELAKTLGASPQVQTAEEPRLVIAGDPATVLEVLKHELTNRGVYSGLLH